MSWKVPLFKTMWDEEDVSNVSDSIRRGMYWAMGPYNTDFEDDLASYHNVKYSLSFNSGTSALHALMIALEIGPGDEVLVPSFTYIATCNAVLFVGAKPIFCEIDERNYGIDPADVINKINSKTKAIVAVNLFGGSSRLEELKKIADDQGIPLIEDNAQSMGATLNGKKLGTFGVCGVLSFCANKIISTGEGGAIVTNSNELYEKMKLLRSHGRAETQNYFNTSKYMEYIQIGYNWRMPDMNAALGVSQLKKIEKIIEMRQNIARRLKSNLQSISDKIFLPEENNNERYVFANFTIRLKGKIGIRDKLIEHLDRKKVLTRIFERPVHLSVFHKEKYGINEGLLPKTEQISKQVLTLPMFPEMKESEADYISESIIEFFN